MSTEPNFTVERYYLQPGEAHTWVNDAQYPRQRPIREHHVDFLTYLVKTKQLREGTEVALAYLGSKPYTVNGNHTIRAIMRAEVPYWITLVRHQVTSMDEMDHLYTTYDRQLPRSPRDMLKAYGFGDHSGLAQREGENLYGAMRLVLSGLVHDRPKATKEHGYLRDTERLYVAALQWTDEAKQFCADIAGVARRWHEFLRRQPLMAAAIVLYRYEPGRAETFWSAVANENHADPRHPTRQLARWLLTESHKPRIKALDLIAATSLAWNYAYHDRPLRSFTLPSTEMPMHFEGTPHTRSSVMRYVDSTWTLLEKPMPYDEPGIRKGRHDAA
jgi:hypothetical protein